MDYGGEPAPDGHSYVEFLLVPPALIDVYRRLEEAIGIAETIPEDGKVISDALVALQVDLEAEVTAAADACAQAADAAIREEIQRTMVRPPTGKHRLEDSIASRGVGGPDGGVGVADVDVLDSTAVDDNGEPYWRAQEEGFTGNVGRKISGVFQPGDSPASGDENRVHAFFEPGPGKQMLIQRPIQARHFISHGIDVADTVRVDEFRAIERRYVAKITALMGGLE